MHPVAEAAALVAAVIHVWFFLMESVWFMRPSVWGRFGISSTEEASTVRSFAYNQGFYNLFLALGVGIGVALVATDAAEAGRAIILFACGSMAAAGVILYLSNRSFIRAAAIQALPPLVAILAAVVLR